MCLGEFMSQQQTSDHSEMGVFYVIALCLGITLLVYFVFHQYIVDVVFGIKKFELSLIILFNHKYQLLMNWCNHVSQSRVSLEDMKYLALITGEISKKLLCTLSAVIGILLLLFHPVRRYKSSYSMRTLSQRMQKSFADVYLPENQCKDLMKGDFSMALSPIEFISQHNLQSHDKKLDIHKSYGVLCRQLGQVGSDELIDSQALYILYAGLIAFVAHDRKLGRRILQCATQWYMSSSWLDKYRCKKRLSNAVESSIRRYEHVEKVRSIAAKHHYNSTLLCELLEHARKGGIVPNASFLWLKKEDRTLWYALNNVGREAVFVEAAAITAHWQAEKMLNTKITTPMIKPAIEALQQEIYVYS